MTTITTFGNLYLGNKMTGIPYFNAEWFDSTATQLRTIPGVLSVFNPADEDRRRGFEPMTCPTGDIEEAKAHGFIAREALGADWAWIAAHSDGLVVGPSWAESKGTISEIACHQALGLPVWEWQAIKEAMNGSFDFSYEHLMSPSWQLPSLTEFIG